MITSLHNSIHLTERETVLLRRCMCPSGRIINIKNMDAHNLLTLQYAFVKGHIHISNSSNNNKPRDSTHATLSPYGKHHACPHTTVYNIPDDPHSVQLGNATTTAAVSDDYLHDQSVLSSFHSKASRWFPLSLANVYTTWVRRKGLTFSGTNRPSLGLCWDQFVS